MSETRPARPDPDPVLGTGAGRSARVGADGLPLPGLGDPWVRGVLALTLLLQAASWWLLEGYLLADSVEYMERAYFFVRSEPMIDSRQIRSFGFSGLLVPFFWVADLLGMQDFKPVVALVRLFQMGIGLTLVLACVRLGARIGGRVTGIAGGLLVGINPVFLQFSVSPLADVAAAVCVALGLERLLAPTDRRGGLGAGLWFGAALLMAYKTIPIAGVVVLLVALRDRRRGLASLGGFGLGYAGALLLQISLDRLVYGGWGASLSAYFGENAVSVVVRLLLRVGLREWGEALAQAYWGVSPAAMAGHALRQLQPPDWFWTHRGELLVWPLLPVAALGLVRCLRQASWATSLIGITLAVNVYFLSQKGAKEFRLWLPLLPLMGPLLGWGLAWLAGPVARRSWRSALVAVLLIAATVLGAQTLRARNTRKFGGFWRAMEYVCERAAQQHRSAPGRPPVRVASSYNWAVFMRESADVELQKLPHQLDGWNRLEEDQQYEVFDRLREQDWLIVHIPTLTNPGHKTLTDRVNGWFQVEAVFWDPQVYEDIGPILVMRRRTVDDLPQHTLFDVLEDADPDEIRGAMGFGEPVRLIRSEFRKEPCFPVREELWFLGFTYEVLPGDGHGWITFYYYAVTGFEADYEFVHRLSSYDRRRWEQRHLPAWGVHRTVTWKPGWIVRESLPVVAVQDPDDWREPFRPIGWAYRRGDHIPVDLWLDVASFYLACVHCDEELLPGHECAGVARGPEEGAIQVSGRLKRARFDEDRPLRRGLQPDVLEAGDDWRWSEEGLVRVGGFFLPVHPWARVPDDGQRLAE